MSTPFHTIKVVLFEILLTISISGMMTFPVFYTFLLAVFFPYFSDDVKLICSLDNPNPFILRTMFFLLSVNYFLQFIISVLFDKNRTFIYPKKKKEMNKLIYNKMLRIYKINFVKTIQNT